MTDNSVSFDGKSLHQIAERIAFRLYHNHEIVRDQVDDVANTIFYQLQDEGFQQSTESHS